MQQQIQTLKDSELTQVLADGFALLYHHKPKFPVTYLAHYLKNHQLAQVQKKKLSDKVSHNKKLLEQISKKQLEVKNKEKANEQHKKKIQGQQKQFLNKLQHTEYHEDILDQFCDWIQKKFNLTGVYIGQLKNKKKKINLEQQDSQEAHIQAQAPKIIYFQYSSISHQSIMLNKTLSQESVLGRLLTGSEQVGDAEPPAQGQEGGVKQQKPKDQIYFSTVVDNKQLHFFKYPRLGSFFGIGIKINSYLSNKLFDQNSQKVAVYHKQFQQYQKLREQRLTKFQQQKVSSGADQQQLQRMQKQFEKTQAQFQQPKLKQFDTIKRQFVFGFDTLGQDRQISKQDQIKIKQYVNYLKKYWQHTQIQALKIDIGRHLKLADKIQAPHQQTFLKIISQEDKQLLSHQQVQKNKNNEKLMQLQLDTLRAQKIKQHLADQKYQPFLQQILKAKVLKYQQILKYWFIFTGKKKQQINYTGTNVIDYRKVKDYFTKDIFVKQMADYMLRGSKPQKVQNYAKWQRLQKNLQKLQASTVAVYNIYLAYILRYLQLAAKVRKADRLKRITIMQQQRRVRAAKIKQNNRKQKQKQDKLAALKAEAAEKQQPFDQQAWLTHYNQAQENQLADPGPKILDEIDRDLENGQQIFPEEIEQQNAQNPAPAE